MCLDSSCRSQAAGGCDELAFGWPDPLGTRPKIRSEPVVSHGLPQTFGDKAVLASLMCGRRSRAQMGGRRAVDGLEWMQRRGGRTSKSDGMNDAARASEVQAGRKVLAPAGAQLASPRRKPWGHWCRATGCPVRGERFLKTDSNSPRNRLAVPPCRARRPSFAPLGLANLCREPRTHGSRRGLACCAPNGAGSSFCPEESWPPADFCEQCIISKCLGLPFRAFRPASQQSE